MALSILSFMRKENKEEEAKQAYFTELFKMVGVVDPEFVKAVIKGEELDYPYPTMCKFKLFLTTVKSSTPINLKSTHELLDKVKIAAYEQFKQYMLPCMELGEYKGFVFDDVDSPLISEAMGPSEETAIKKRPEYFDLHESADLGVSFSPRATPDPTHLAADSFYCMRFKNLAVMCVVDAAGHDKQAYLGAKFCAMHFTKQMVEQLKNKEVLETSLLKALFYAHHVTATVGAWVTLAFHVVLTINGEKICVSGHEGDAHLYKIAQGVFQDLSPITDPTKTFAMTGSMLGKDLSKIDAFIHHRIFVHKVLPGDLLIAVSDGVSDQFQNPQPFFTSLICKHTRPHEFSKAIIQGCLENSRQIRDLGAIGQYNPELPGKNDDKLCVVAKVDEPYSSSVSTS